MLERIKTPQDLYNFELGSALTMERKALKLLESSAEQAHDPELQQLLHRHQEETRQQIGNIEQAFKALGWDVDDAPCLPMDALQMEAKAKAKMTSDDLVDAVLVAGSAETEHHEIAVYDSLIATARTMGREDVAGLLQQNLEQEQRALQGIKGMTERVLQSSPGRPV